KEKPRPGRPGLERKAGCRGLSGPSVQFSLRSSCRRPCRWRFLIESPRIAPLYKLLDGVVGDASLLFSQPSFRPLNDLPGAPQGESNRKSEDFSLSSYQNRT